MKRIAILTLNGYSNYGNRLQNYATQEILKSLGFDVETVLANLSTKGSHSLSSRINNFTFNKLHERIEKVIYKKLIIERENTFKEFTTNHIRETNFKISDNNIPVDLEGRYNYFLTGSDQVWNPKNIKQSSIYFLTFAPKVKRIAYAPSFGVNEITDEYVERYKKWLSEMGSLSVREEAGAKIVKKLTNRDVLVLLDPTMMLSKEQWLSISKKATIKPLENKYLLTYFLGTIPREYMIRIKKIAKLNNLQVINLTNIKDKETYRTGPSEFIDFIYTASVFCTDSFHGVVFSILMEIPFIVFERKGNSQSMFSRVDNILKIFKLESRKSNNIVSNDQIFNTNYTHILPILEVERKKALDYLKNALDVNC